VREEYGERGVEESVLAGQIAPAIHVRAELEAVMFCPPTPLQAAIVLFLRRQRRSAWVATVDIVVFPVLLSSASVFAYASWGLSSSSNVRGVNERMSVEIDDEWSDLRSDY
jgi:hypothetical protein